MTSTGVTAPRVAIWGTFDVDNFGDHLFPRIFELEMRRRLPRAEIRAFSPLGHLHPVPLDGGRMVEALGAWSPERLAELARAHDLVAIGGGEIIHGQDDVYGTYYGTSVEEARRLRPSAFFIEGLGPVLEERCAAAWHGVGIPFDLDAATAERVRAALDGRAYVSVRDEISRDRLVRAGVTREVSVVPDSAFLVDRVMRDEQVQRRLGYLRGIGSYPAADRPLVVQGSRPMLPHVEELAGGLAAAVAEAGDVPIVLVETGLCHGDREFADALAAALDRPVHRMPASPTVEDIVAAIVHARGFVGISLHGNILAVARGLPSAILDLAGGYSKLAGFAALAGREDALVRSPADLPPALRRVLSQTATPGPLGEITARVEAHFDALAELAERSAASRVERSPVAVRRAPERDQALKKAFDARGRRVLEQRIRLGDEIEALEQALRERDARLATAESFAEQRRDRIVELEVDAAQRDARIAELEADAAQREARMTEVEADAATAQSELERLQQSRTFRYTAPLRAVYGGLRRLFA